MPRSPVVCRQASVPQSPYSVTNCRMSLVSHVTIITGYYYLSSVLGIMDYEGSLCEAVILSKAAKAVDELISDGHLVIGNLGVAFALFNGTSSVPSLLLLQYPAYKS